MRLVVQSGDGGGDSDRLFVDVYDLLRSRVGNLMVAESPGHTLQATGLVHEAYLRLADAGRGPGAELCRGLMSWVRGRARGYLAPA